MELCFLLFSGVSVFFGMFWSFCFFLDVPIFFCFFSPIFFFRIVLPNCSSEFFFRCFFSEFCFVFFPIFVFRFFSVSGGIGSLETGSVAGAGPRARLRSPMLTDLGTVLCSGSGARARKDPEKNPEKNRKILKTPKNINNPENS